MIRRRQVDLSGAGEADQGRGRPERHAHGRLGAVPVSSRIIQGPRPPGQPEGYAMHVHPMRDRPLFTGARRGQWRELRVDGVLGSSRLPTRQIIKNILQNPGRLDGTRGAPPMSEYQSA